MVMTQFRPFTGNLTTISCTNPSTIQSSNIILFQLKELKVPGHILESIDRSVHIADNVYLNKSNFIIVSAFKTRKEKCHGTTDFLYQV